MQAYELAKRNEVPDALSSRIEDVQRNYVGFDRILQRHGDLQVARGFVEVEIAETMKAMSEYPYIPGSNAPLRQFQLQIAELRSKLAKINEQDAVLSQMMANFL